MPVTIREALELAGKKLRESGANTPTLDAGVLLAHVTGLDRAGLYRERERVLAEEVEARFFSLVGRRAAGEPLAYLIGHKEFMGLDFTVNPHVLIPRPETELLVEKALELLPPAPVVVDVGAGSGAIAVSLAALCPKAVVYATDCSQEALAVAGLNAARHGVANRVFLCPGDMLEPLAGRVQAGGVDLIVANLPYIPTEDLLALPREIRLFEPPSALDGGAGGLELYRRLIPAAALLLKKGGYLLMEIGCDQGRRMVALLAPPVWEAIILQDLAGLDRLVVARRV